MTPRVLLLYYSYTNQTRRVADAMAEVFVAEGCEVTRLELTLSDQRFSLELPLQPFWRRILKFVVPQLLGQTAEIKFDEQLLDAEYDLVCIGSPTWWFYPAVPITSFLKLPAASKVLRGSRFAVFTVCRAFWWVNYRTVRRLATRAGGSFADSATFAFHGNQVQSMLSFLNYLQSGENRERFMGCRIYAFGVPDEGIEKAKSFARTLASSQLGHNSN
ncbi:MAG: flavodoxin family protein [Planctomycetaceae bacterium]|nr:hypothetical protein [Planctomycetales bacterium]MCB9925221.1 flavodoxin family protein [Planctomycetaceae bacterium]